MQPPAEQEGAAVAGYPQQQKKQGERKTEREGRKREKHKHFDKASAVDTLLLVSAAAQLVPP